MKIAAVWVGHVRTFHRIWPENINNFCWNPLKPSQPVRSFFYTFPAGQCRRNRPNEPPRDYSTSDALEFVRLSLNPEHTEVRNDSQAAKDLFDLVCSRRKDMNRGHVGSVVFQFVRRLEAWNDFKSRVPDWETFDAIAFHRPDVGFDGHIDVTFPVFKNSLYTFTSLGPPAFNDGMDDRFAIGCPEAMDHYMRMGESVRRLLIDERKQWNPEQNYNLHCKSRGVNRLVGRYSDVKEKDHYVNIARFQDDDGRTLIKKLNEARSAITA